MDAQKQIVERLKQANNVLVTVNNNPSVDELAALLGFGLALTKLDKHATAVYSGETPSTIEFLQPEETIEKTTDSLRDFIISLDKSKADKLRYKVEDSVVRIFITPYRTSISDADLEFSQGDFNIDAVVALGVHEQKDLDQAITVHGRIFHDATIITINNSQATDLGSINWLNESASSISEMVTTVIMLMGNDILDDQIATALLTGIVAETKRFSNEKTTANTMKASAVLMSAGANQQLVSTELAKPDESEELFLGEEALEAVGPSDTIDSEKAQKPVSNDGTLRINHDDDSDLEISKKSKKTDLVEEFGDLPEPQDQAGAEGDASIGGGDDFIFGPESDKTYASDTNDELPTIGKAMATGDSAENELLKGKTYKHTTIKNPPTFPVYDTNSDTGEEDEFVDPMSLPEVVEESGPVLDHGVTEVAENNEEMVLPPKPEVVKAVPRPDETLADIERDVNSPHVSKYDELDVTTLKHPDGTGEPAVTLLDNTDDLRQTSINRPVSPADQPPLPPIVALNAQPLGDRLHDPVAQGTPGLPPLNPDQTDQNTQPPIVLPPPPPAPQQFAPVPPPYPSLQQPMVDQPLITPTPYNNQSLPPVDSQSPTAPPPVPPPIMPPFPQ